jgi:hypothetical protein
LHAKNVSLTELPRFRDLEGVIHASLVDTPSSKGS